MLNFQAIIKLKTWIKGISLDPMTKQTEMVPYLLCKLNIMSASDRMNSEAKATSDTRLGLTDWSDTPKRN